ncbi:MAG: hypothetical protein GY913_00035 [Proteobacteria bacterium]|nr:hypothetical protein [Pseudomonadota bacterium]
MSLPSQYAQLERKAADWDEDGFMDVDDTDEDVAARHGLELGDCDDSDAAVHPDAGETPYNAVDDDCDPTTSDTDTDGDGFDATQVGGADCDDADPAVFPDAEESWYDGVDQDCSGGSDYDQDGDGSDAIEHGGTDCDDTDATVGQPLPPFGDGAGGESAGTACTDGDGISFTSGDCDDAEPLAYPGATEVCDDGIDNDCDANTDCSWTDESLAGHLRLDRENNDGFAIDVAVMADFTGDNVPDLVIGAPEGDGGEGCVYSVAGGTQDLETAFIACGYDGEAAFGQYVGGGRDANADGASDYSGTSAHADRAITATRAGAAFGTGLRDGDADGDGSANLLVSSFSSAEGTVLVFQGGSLITSEFDALVSISRDSRETAAAAGMAIGDFNRDGEPDLTYGAPLNDLGGSAAGAVFVVWGPLSGTRAADTTLQGYIGGEQAGSDLRALGDIDGDGTDDLISSATRSQTATGAAYILFGTTQ